MPSVAAEGKAALGKRRRLSAKTSVEAVLHDADAEGEGESVPSSPSSPRYVPGGPSVLDDSSSEGAAEDDDDDGLLEEDSSEAASPSMPPPPDLLTHRLAARASRGGGAPKAAASAPRAAGPRAVRWRVVADTERGANVLVVQMGPDAPLGRLMTAWCENHRLPRRAARFCLSGREVRELRDSDTARTLIRSGFVSAAAVPAVGEESQVEVLVRAVPNPSAHAPGLAATSNP